MKKLTSEFRINVPSEFPDENTVKMFPYHYVEYESLGEAIKELGEEAILQALNNAVEWNAKALAYADKLKKLRR